MSFCDYLIIDIGSTYTKLRCFKEQKLIASGQAPTTLQHVLEGVNRAWEQMPGTEGKEPTEADEILATSSAAGGLRMVAIGYMTRVTARAAKEVAMNAGARVLEVISSDQEPEERSDMLREINPDLILLAGGTDSGDETSLVENATVIANSKVKAKVVLAGNSSAQPRAAEILDRAGISWVKTPNIMPTIHQLKVDRAREAIHREFIRQITRAKGTAELIVMLSSESVIPTPGAVLMAAELLAMGTKKEAGIGSLVIIDLGGATTDVHSVLPQLEALPDEERGLIINNEKQLAYRTVEGNLGMRISAAGIDELVDLAGLLSQRGGEAKDNEEALAQYIAKVTTETDYLPQGEEECYYDQLLAGAAIEIALKRHAGYYCQEANPEMGIAPGMAMGRDLRGVETVICVGGYCRHNEQLSRDLVIKALQNKAISLLPDVKEVRVLVDHDYILYAAGAIASVNPDYALKVMKNSLADEQQKGV